MTPHLLAAAQVLCGAALEPELDLPARRGLVQALRALQEADAAPALLTPPPVPAGRYLKNLGTVRQPVKAAARAWQADPAAASAPARGIAKALVGLRAYGLATEIYRSLLARKPFEAAAAGDYFDLLIQRGLFQEAAKVLDRITAETPDAPELPLCKARYLVKSGASAAAVAHLDRMIAAGQDGPGVLVLRVTAELNLGNGRAAADMAARFLRSHPDHKGLWFRRIEADIQNRAFDTARQSLAAAAGHLGPDPTLSLLEARLCTAAGDTGKAHGILQHLRAATTDPRVDLISGRLLREEGRPAEAAEAFKRVLARDPRHRLATIALIDCAMDAEAYEDSAARLAQALELFPDDIELRLRQARELKREGREEAAEAAYRALAQAYPDHPGLAIETGRSLAARGAYEAAAKSLATALAIAPENPGLLLLNTDILLATRGAAEAERWLSARAQLSETPQALARQDWRILMRLCELNGDLGATERATTLLRNLTRQLGPADTALWVRALLAGLTLGEESVSAEALERLIAAPVVKAEQAFIVLDAIRSVASAQRIEVLTERLAARIPPAERAHFEVGATLRQEGPIAAIKRAARVMPHVERWGDALLKAKILDAAGLRPLAVRYLRLAIRRWPHAEGLRLICAGICVQIGQYAQARRVLDKTIFAPQDVRAAVHRVRALAETGQSERALARIEKVARQSPTNAVVQLGLRLNLAAGDLEGAERFATGLRNLALGLRGFHAHFQASMFGSQLNELRILARMPEDADPARFYHPAKALLDDWVAQAPAGRNTTGHAIPASIWQYWDSREAPPMVAEIMQGWPTEGFAYRRFDLRSALDFLSAEFGRDAVRAFRLANHKAEAADFFRLCLLLRKGGIYVDADDRRLGNLHRFLAGRRGCLLFREPFGALANNVIITSPGHPVLEEAVTIATGSLLARENDNTWSKTGPGLLTRAAACAIANRSAEVAAAGLQILPQQVLAPVIGTHLVLPYKATSAYWDWSGTHALPSAVEQVLSDPVAA